MTEWETAVNDLAVKLADWAPDDLERHWRTSSTDPAVRTLELARAGRRLYLAPATWAIGSIPASVDLWSSRGPRVRFVGPNPLGEWKTVTSDLVDMHLAWKKDSLAGLCEDLLAV